MNLTEFEALRDLPGKVIRGDIRLSKRQATAPSIVAEDIRVENENGVDLRMTVTWNCETGYKAINVHVPGTGPICRLEADGPNHPPAGRSHKHALKTERCPDRNLPDAVRSRPDLAGATLPDVFNEFCHLAGIEHAGALIVPDGNDGGAR